MSDPELYPVPAELAARAHMDRAGYEAARIAARETPDAYWGEQARRLDWMTFPSRIKDVSFNKEDFRIRWFEDGVLNVSANCMNASAAWPMCSRPTASRRATASPSICR